MSSSHRQASIIIGIGLIVVSIVLLIYAFSLPKVNNLELEDYSSSTVTSAASSISSTDYNSTALEKQNSVVDKTTVINENHFTAKFASLGKKRVKYFIYYNF